MLLNCEEAVGVQITVGRFHSPDFKIHNILCSYFVSNPISVSSLLLLYSRLCIHVQSHVNKVAVLGLGARHLAQECLQTTDCRLWGSNPVSFGGSRTS